MKSYERLIRYASFPTASDESNPHCPSTPAQLDFARALTDELRALGVSDVVVDDNGYLYASIPATPRLEQAPALGFIAHMDVSPAAPDAPIRPRVVPFDGNDIVLNSSPRAVLSRAEFPILNKYIGKTLVVTDGQTLLGADDKAGIAEIVTACEQWCTHPELRHPAIRIAFTPDEEIGRGADLFDLARFNAAYAYTVDGASYDDVNYETFNAASLTVRITGRSIHPGDAKNKMVNASLVAMEYISMLPVLERPEHTSGYDGFYHLTEMRGNVESAELHFILRDHDLRRLADRKTYAQRAADELNRRYHAAVAAVKLHDGYRNMREKIEPAFHLIEHAYAAIRALGATPVSTPVRGGTDGCVLSFRGLPCPNLGTGSHNHHGRFEFACVEEMEQCVSIITGIATCYADSFLKSR